MRFAALLLLIAAIGPPFTSAQTTQGRGCAVSAMIRDSAPPDPNADPVAQVAPANWYINETRTIWAGPVPNAGWPSGGLLFAGDRTVKGQKTYWVRPRGTQLLIAGRRLDANAPPVEAHIPCCYTSGFQIVGLFFPTPGCWEVTASAGDETLQFVTLVGSEVVRQAR
jgi:hypothetical protein